MFRSLKLLAVGLTILTSLGLTSSAHGRHPRSPFSELIVFGDSLSDAGNLHLASGGVVTPPPYYKGRFSNGPVWVEVLAEQLGLPTPEASLAGGTNYAFGGAETGPGLSFFDTPNVGVQIEFFLEDRGGFTGDELIVVEAGSNDFLWDETTEPEVVMENLRQHITDLAAAGGKTFLVANSPIDDPRAVQLNRLLKKQLPKLARRLGVTILLYDMARVFNFILDHSEFFGITNVTDPACPGCGIGIPDPDAEDTMVPNPDEYFLWDLIHPTRVVHAIIGEAAALVVQHNLRRGR
jgi:3-phytase